MGLTPGLDGDDDPTDWREDLQSLPDVDVCIRGSVLQLMLTSFSARAGYVAFKESFLFLAVIHGGQFADQFVSEVTAAIDRAKLTQLLVNNTEHTCAVTLGRRKRDNKVCARHFDTFPSAVSQAWLTWHVFAYLLVLVRVEGRLSPHSRGLQSKCERQGVAQPDTGSQ